MKEKEQKNILIIGAGIGGKLLAEDIKRYHSQYRVIGFVDDRSKVHRTAILGRVSDLPQLVETYQVDEMVIAIPSASGKQVRQILLVNRNNRVPIRIVPRSQKVIGRNDVRYSEIKDIDLEDFLGRPFFKRNVEKLKRLYKNRTVLITGGAGSIGSEIVRQLIDLEAKRVIVYDNSEYLIFNLDQCLKEKKVSFSRYNLVIGSVTNYKKINRIIRKEKPDLIFHAAAYKHVYLMEDNIDEAVQNNILGTKNVVDAAVANQVKNFIFISTDKVVNPTSIMGATKKLGEYYISCLPKGKTKFNIVRFGNVINSHGSVLPLFERQIRDHKYVTVTHKKIKRFFMSIREAAQLVINTSTRNNQGEIFILDMGELINIYETAQCLIRSKNLIPEEDVEVKIIGLKKGEKLIEELFTEKEKKNLVRTNINNVFRLKNMEKCPSDITEAFDNFEKLTSNNANQSLIRSYFFKLFPSLVSRK